MKKLLIVFTLLLIVFVCCFLFINSGFFVKRIVLPKIASSVDAKITVEDVDFSIFKGIELVDFKVEGKDGRPSLLNAKLVRVRYKFSPLLKGEFHVDEVKLENVTVHIAEDKDGILNIPEIPSSESDSGKQESEEEGTVVIPRFDIKNVAINNLSIIYDREASEDTSGMSVQISEVSFSLDRLAPGEAFKINSECSMTSKIDDRANIHSDLCKLHATGMIREDLFPGLVDLSFSIEKLAGNAASVKLDGRILRFSLNCEGDGKNYTLNQCEFSELYQGKVEASASLTGGISVDPMSANLGIEMKTLGADALNLLGGVIGDYEFGDTSINYVANLEILDNASVFSCAGDLKISRFSVSSEDLGISGLKPIELTLNHKIAYDQNRNLVKLDKLNMLVIEESTEIVNLNLSEPTAISFNEVMDFQNSQATINLAVTDFDLGFLRPLIPESAGIESLQGVVNENVEIKIDGGGDHVEINGSSQIKNITVRAAGEDFSNLGIKNQFSLTFKEFFSKLAMEQFKISGTVSDNPAIDINLNAFIDLQGKTGTVGINPITVQPNLVSLIPKELLQGYKITNLNSAGNVEIVIEKDEKVIIKGSLNSAPIFLHKTSEGDTKLSLAPKFLLNAFYTPDGQLQINQCDINLDNPQESQGIVTLAGKVNTNILEGELRLKVSEIKSSLLSMGSGMAGMDFDFGNTRLDSESTVKLANKGDDCTISGKVMGQEISAKSTQLGIPALRPLEFSTSYSGTLSISKNILSLESFSFFLQDQDRRVITGELDQTAMLNLNPDPATSTSTNAPATFNIKMDNLSLDLIDPLIPKEVLLDVTASILNSKIKVSILDLMSQISCTGNLDLEGITIPAKTGPDEARKQNLDTQFGFDVTYSDDGQVKIRKGSVFVEESGNPLLQLNAEGEFDAALQGKPSEFFVRSLVPIQAKRLEEIALGVTESPDQEESETGKIEGSDTIPSSGEMEAQKGGSVVVESKGDEPTEDSLSKLPKLDVQLNINIPEIQYNQIIVTDLNPTIMVRNNQLVINPFTFNINEGTAQFEARCDYEVISMPKYGGDIKLENVDLRLLANSMLPEYTDVISGGLSKGSVTFEGTGITNDDIMKGLNAKIDGEITNLNCANFMENYTDLLSLARMKQSDFVFETVRIDSQIANSEINLTEFFCHNSDLRILSKGLVEFGGNWLPDLGLTLGFSGKLKDRVKQVLKLNEGESGYFYTENLPFKVTSWSPTTLIKEWIPSVADTLFNLDQLDPAVKAAVVGLKDVRGVLSGKTSPKDAIKGAVGIYESFTKKKDKQKNVGKDTEGQSGEIPEEPNENLESFFNIFGR